MTAYLAVLHDVQLTQPRLIKRVACRVYYVTQSVLLGENQHGVEETLHGIDGAYQCGPANIV